MDKQKNTLYLDMDDVVADWMGAAKAYLSLEWERGVTMIPQKDWMKLRQHHRFYRDLPLLPGAIDLVLWASDYARRHNMNFAFLTAIPSTNDVPYVYLDKIHWASIHFPGIPVFFGPYAHDKQTHCRPGDILIDDRYSNCIEWWSKGGVAHQYSTWTACQHWIQHSLDNQREECLEKHQQQKLILVNG